MYLLVAAQRLVSRAQQRVHPLERLDDFVDLSARQLDAFEKCLYHKLQIFDHVQFVLYVADRCEIHVFAEVFQNFAQLRHARLIQSLNLPRKSTINNLFLTVQEIIKCLTVQEGMPSKVGQSSLQGRHSHLK